MKQNQLNSIEKREISKTLIYSSDFSGLSMSKVSESTKLFLKHSKIEFKKYKHRELRVLTVENKEHLVEVQKFFKSLCNYIYNIIGEVPKAFKRVMAEFETFAIEVWKKSFTY